MKKLTFLRGIMILTIFFASIFVIASYGYNQKTGSISEEQNETKFDTKKQEIDAKFLVNVAEINLEKIQLGKLAQQKGGTTHIKELGKTMEVTHRNLQFDLTVLAKSKKISIPSSATNDANYAYLLLNEKSGTDFDKAYADMMVSGNKNTIGFFEKAATESYDTEIKNWATASLDVLRQHLDLSIDSQNKFAGMYLKNK